jgi:uncharacterized peroxidase-related enzyme
MAHIELQEGLPGIVGLLAFRPDTAQALLQLAEVLLRGPNSLTFAEREMIAAYVSYRNDSRFCHLSHSAAAIAHLGGQPELLDRVKSDPETAAVSDKLKALLNIAGLAQKGGKNVTSADIDRAHLHGATDQEIHDTVLIAAAFCMYNRYVDGLGTWQPAEPEAYREMGERMAHEGYARAAKPASREVA